MTCLDLTDTSQDQSTDCQLRNTILVSLFPTVFEEAN